MDNTEFNSDSLLCFLLDRCNMSLEDARSEIEKMTSKKYLEKHAFDIWQGADSRWRTYLPDDTAKNKRRLIAKSTREKIETEIITYYKELNKSKQKEKITLRSFYQTWLDYKKLKSSSSLYIRRIHSDWEKFYLNDSLIDVPLVKLTFDMLEEWALKKIRVNKMTKTQYYNMAVIIRQSLDYAVQKGILPENLFQRVKIDRKLFHCKKKPEDSTQVFLTDEQARIEKKAYADFVETGHVACLAVLLHFQTGLRVGEMVAIRKSDISGNYLHVQRMEVKVTEQLPDGSWGPQTFDIVEHVKSSAGDRQVYLSTKAREIISLIEKSNQEHGYKDEDFLFLNKNGRIHERSIDCRLRKYCNQLGIKEKGAHKTRKTYISTLIDANININEIRKQVGHEDERTTYRNYCFNRMTQADTENLFEKALV